MDVLWFKQQQRRAGVTADQIAERMGRTRANVSHILNGRQRMSLDWAKAFAEVLQVPLATVLEKAGVTDAPTAQQVQPGFADSMMEELRKLAHKAILNHRREREFFRATSANLIAQKLGLHCMTKLTRRSGS